jgi:hypothetical protein
MCGEGWENRGDIMQSIRSNLYAFYCFKFIKGSVRDLANERMIADFKVVGGDCPDGWETDNYRIKSLSKGLKMRGRGDAVRVTTPGATACKKMVKPDLGNKLSDFVHDINLDTSKKEPRDRIQLTWGQGDTKWNYNGRPDKKDWEKLIK